MHLPAWQKGKNIGRRRKQTSKQTGKRVSSGLVKKIIYIIIIIVIVKRYICKVYILYRSSGMELPNCCKLYVHREQSVACSIAESVETSGYDLETFNLKKRDWGVCVCVCGWGGGGGVSVSFGGLLYARMWVFLRNCFNRKCF